MTLLRRFVKEPTLTRETVRYRSGAAKGYCVDILSCTTEKGKRKRLPSQTRRSTNKGSRFPESDLLGWDTFDLGVYDVAGDFDRRPII